MKELQVMWQTKSGTGKGVPERRRGPDRFGREMTGVMTDYAAAVTERFFAAEILGQMLQLMRCLPMIRLGRRKNLGSSTGV